MKKKEIMIKIDQEDLKKLDEQAAKQGRSRKNMAEFFFRQGLNQTTGDK